MLSEQQTLYYIHDPMCSWCWGFRPVFQQLLQQLPDNVEIKYLLGGLAADNQEPMPDDMQQFLQQTWRTIQNKIPGTEFNFDFWSACLPRRSTYPACRAVIAARKQQPDIETTMIQEIQKTYYLEAKNPSDDNALIYIAGQLNLNDKVFKTDLNSERTQETLKQEIQFSRRLGAQGFPSLVFKNENSRTLLQLDYNNADTMILQINDLIKYGSD